MSDKKISQLDAATTPLAGTETLPIVQSGATKKVPTDDLTVKNVRSNATSGVLQVSGPGASQTRVMTTPDADFTAARTDAAQSFTGLQTFNGGTSASDYDFNDSASRFSTLTEWSKQSYVESVRQLRAPTGLDYWSTSATGSGSVTQSGVALYLNTDATASSTATAQLSNLGLTTIGGQGLYFWNNPIRVEFLISNVAAQTANGQSWLLLRSDAVSAADPSAGSNRAIGFRLDAGAAKGLTWDGSSLTVVDLATSLSVAPGVYTSLAFQRNSEGGTIEFFVNGVSKGTASSPSNAYASGVIGLAVNNGGDVGLARFMLFDTIVTTRDA